MPDPIDRDRMVHEGLALSRLWSEDKKKISCFGKYGRADPGNDCAKKCEVSYLCEKVAGGFRW